MTDSTALALAVAVLALERIADERETSLRWRRMTGGAAIEKPNCRTVAEEALDAIAATLEP